MSSSTAPDRRRGDVCALCGKPAAAGHRPFCSQGCRDRDLLQWLGEGHRIPGPPADESSMDFGAEGMDSER